MTSVVTRSTATLNVGFCGCPEGAPCAAIPTTAQQAMTADTRDFGAVRMWLSISGHIIDAMRIAVGADHAGFEMKRDLIPVLRALGHEVDDLGTHSTTAVDYPDCA